jgi:hypothetical protein
LHTASAKHPYHFCLVEVDGDRLTLQAVDIHGKVIDRLTLSKKNGAFDKEYLASALPVDTFEKLAEPPRKLFYHGYEFTERIDSTKAWPVTLKLTGGPNAMKYRLTVEEQAAPSYEMKTTAGTVPAGEVADVTVHIRPRPGVKMNADGWLNPVLRLRCDYEIKGRKGWLYSGRLSCPALPASAK